MARAAIRIKVNARGLPRDPNLFSAVREAQIENALIMGSAAAQNAREVLGTNPDRAPGEPSTADSYDAYVDENNHVHVFNPKRAARFAEEGTERHIIKALPGARRGMSHSTGKATSFIKGAKKLKFPSSHPKAKGGYMFASEVDHPGTKAHRIIRRAIEDNMGEAKANIRRHVGAELSGRRVR